jgi:hypothetical protein
MPAMQLLDPASLRAGELCFHVLAHVEGTRQLPASAYSPAYVAWARSLLGDPERRTLAEDARMLAGAFPTHSALAGAQALARLYTSVERVLAAGSRPLAELSASDVDEPSALAHLQELGAPGELLYCAFTLELMYFLQLPAPPPSPVELLELLLELVPLAPGLRDASVGCVRSLHQRGRVWGREIWVGHPDAEVAPTLEHVAWQAAHEATVVAVAAREPALGERQVEHAAVVELARRAREHGRQAAHARWLETVALLAAP